MPKCPWVGVCHNLTMQLLCWQKFNILTKKYIVVVFFKCFWWFCLPFFLPITSKRLKEVGILKQFSHHFLSPSGSLFLLFPILALLYLCSAGPLVGLQILSGREFSSNPIPFEAENFASDFKSFKRFKVF